MLYCSPRYLTIQAKVMEKFEINELDQLMNQANKALSDSQAILKELADDPSLTSLSDETTINKAQIIQLILQYRLDTQDALEKLLQIDHNLLQTLGIQPQHSSKMNLDRLKFALGNDDLQHILHALGLLVSSLLRVAQRYQQNNAKVSKQKQTLRSRYINATHDNFSWRLQKATVQQKLFISHMTEFSNHLDEWNKLAPIGPVLDHIAALRGPISQFFQAIENGLALSYYLYEITNKGLPLDHTLTHLLQQTESVLKQMPLTPQPQHFFTPAKVDVDEQLEQKASKNRLGQFFNH